MYFGEHLCDRCGKAAASVHLKESVNGHETSRHLCSQCAAKEGLGTNLFSWGSDPFDTMLGSFFMPQSAPSASVCPTCKKSLSDVKRTGRFGCGDCYSFFEKRVDLTPFTAKKGYAGKRPDSKAGEKARKDPVDELNTLKNELKQAVEKEEYESAARLRDKIRELESKEGK